MQHIILFDSDIRDSLLPLTFTRPVSDLRLGILTIKDKWAHLFEEASFSHITAEALEPLFPINIQDENILINSAVIPSSTLQYRIANLQPNEAIMLDGELIATRLLRHQFEYLLDGSDLEDITGYELTEDVQMIRHLWELPSISKNQITADMQLLSMSGHFYPKDLQIRGDHPVFVHPSARLDSAILNAEEGPIFIGEEAWIMDGSILRGPIAIGQHSVVRMGAKLFGGTVAGPKCVLGGEVKNSTLLGYSNKAHEGYLGDSIIGEWCNLGALTSNSNVRNTLSAVPVWNYADRTRQESGQVKCGVFMGDYCRTAILAQLGAGSSIGVSCHLYGSGTCPPSVPSFTWGGMESMHIYQLERAIQVAMKAQASKGMIMGQGHQDLLRTIFLDTQSDRANFPDS
ncbi:MAG: glucose-1-phosphate thymidylyltransferase [Saprospiraceae bacterium]|nr:glucose-1-phosphate thymidylyltransferase [Saprospiraceae bacterium]